MGKQRVVFAATPIIGQPARVIMDGQEIMIGTVVRVSVNPEEHSEIVAETVSGSLYAGPCLRRVLNTPGSAPQPGSFGSGVGSGMGISAGCCIGCLLAVGLGILMMVVFVGMVSSN